MRNNTQLIDKLSLILPHPFSGLLTFFDFPWPRFHDLENLKIRPIRNPIDALQYPLDDFSLPSYKFLCKI